MGDDLAFSQLIIFSKSSQCFTLNWRDFFTVFDLVVIYPICPTTPTISPNFLLYIEFDDDADEEDDDDREVDFKNWCRWFWWLLCWRLIKRIRDQSGFKAWPGQNLLVTNSTSGNFLLSLQKNRSYLIPFQSLFLSIFFDSFKSSTGKIWSIQQWKRFTHILYHRRQLYSKHFL